MSVVVRAAKAFSAYHGPSCQILSFTQGQEIEGDLAVYLATADCPVEVVSDESDQIGAVIAAAASAAAPAAPAESSPTDSPGAAVEPEPAVQAEPEPAAQPSAGTETAVEDAAPAAPAPAEAASFDPAEHNVKDVLAHVEAHPEDLAAVLAAEQAGKQRTTLLDALHDLTATQA